MSVIIAMKDKDIVHIVTTGKRYLGMFTITLDCPSEYKIKKFKNAYIAMSGNGDVIDTFERKVDFNSLSEHITTRELTKELLPYLLKVLEKENFIGKKDPFSGIGDIAMLIVQNNRIWTIDERGVVEHAKQATLGADNEPAFAYIDAHWGDNISRKELAIEAMKFTINYSAASDYPIFVGNSASSEVEIIGENGDTKVDKLYDFINQEE